MDFMKVLDQTVRDIKREVNLKVLKVPEIEQKVLDATSSEPWGPHGSVLQEIAQATKKITDCQIIMNTLWTRLIETGSNWRLVYKALTVIEYLIANGSERAVDDILGHSFRISSISGFEYVEPNGKDAGINVRKKVETILALLNDKEKMQAVREKATANRDKYFGLSSTGITYKSSSSSSSYGSSGFTDRYGGFGSTKENDSFGDNYKNSERRGEGTDWKAEKKDENMKSTGSLASENEPNNSKRAVSKGRRAQKSTLSSTSSTSTKSVSIPSKSLNEQPNNYDDDFDDFDPRGSSTDGPNSTTNKQVDLFGDSLVGDLMDTPASVPTETKTTAAASEVDLFADANFVSAPPTADASNLFANATFVSAPPTAEASRRSDSQGNVDLFATQSTFPAPFTSDVDLFGGSRLSASETKSHNLEPSSTNTFDPFAAIPLNNFEGSDVFGDFASNSGAVPTESSSNSTKNTINILNQPSQTSINNSVLDQNFMAASIPAPKKDAFQVKSGIWADSLSRGLIDLNISAPKKVSLEDIGIVGGLGDGFFDDKEKGPPASAYMGRAMGSGSGLGKSGFTSTSMGGNANFSSLGQQQFGNFK